MRRKNKSTLAKSEEFSRSFFPRLSRARVLLFKRNSNTTTRANDGQRSKKRRKATDDDDDADGRECVMGLCRGKSNRREGNVQNEEGGKSNTFFKTLNYSIFKKKKKKGKEKKTQISSKHTRERGKTRT